MKNVWKAPQWENDKLDFNSDISAVSLEDKYKLIDINEIQNDNGPFIAALERCPSLSAKQNWSCYPYKPKCQVEFESNTAKAIAQIAEDNPYLKVEAGEIASLSAVDHKPGAYGLDIRPKVFDNKTKTWILLDRDTLQKNQNWSSRRHLFVLT